MCCEQFADGSLHGGAVHRHDGCLPPRHSPGTDYTLQVTLGAAAAWFSGVVADASGYTMVFAAGAALMVLALLPIGMYFARAAHPAGVAAPEEVRS